MSLFTTRVSGSLKLLGQYGMNQRQLVNQLQPGRKGGFREKAVKAVKGE
jgi:hypothetical protein